MLADSLLPTTFWAEAVNTACYVQNRVLVTKPHNKTPYELLLGRPPSISFMRPFGCPVTILNTLDPLSKFDRKADEGFLVRYYINSKVFRVFNSRTRNVEENLHINFLENKPNVAESGPEWLFDIDSLTKSMNYEPINAGNQTNGDACIETNVNAGQAGQEKSCDHEYILLPLMLSNSPLSSSTQSTDDKDADEVPDKGDDYVSQRNGQEKEGGASNKEDDQHVQDFRAELDSLLVQQKEGYANSTNRDSTASPSVSTVGPSINTASENINIGSPNINTASPIPNDSSMQSLENTGIFDDAYDDREVGAEADLNNLDTTMNGRTNHKDYQNCLFACFISQIEPKKVIQALTDLSWIEAMQEELLQFKLQKVWTLVDLPKGKRAIGTKWVYKNKKDKRGIVVRNKARLVAQAYNQEEGINYDEVFAHVARIKAIRLFLAYASFIGLIVYQMDVKSAFLYCMIEEEKEDGIFIIQDKYVADILKKFDFTIVKAASTPIETNKALNKDKEAEDVDVHLYRLMIGSLMYLTASRPDIMFAICACARFQVTLKTSHLHTVKRIFRYLKGQPKLGLWYPKDSPFDLEAFSDSDYARASLDRKSTIRGCQFIGKRLISCQCKKQTIDANSTTEAEYVATANYCRQSSRPIHLVANETVYKEWEDKMERAATTASSLEAEQDSGSGPRCQDTIFRGAEAQIRFEAASKQSNDPPLSRVNTLGSGEDNMKLKELMELCMKLSERILDIKIDRVNW
ncbi:putative ribonuclease H-like domain-containing protein [Tanacetum coccineum]